MNFGNRVFAALLTMSFLLAPMTVVQHAEAAKKPPTAKQTRNKAVKQANNKYKASKKVARAHKKAAKKNIMTARSNYKKAYKAEARLGNARLKARNVLQAQTNRYLDAKAKAGPGQNRNNNPKLKAQWDKLIASENGYKNGIKQKHLNAERATNQAKTTLNARRQDYTGAMQERLVAKRDVLVAKRKAHVEYGNALDARRQAAIAQNQPPPAPQQSIYGPAPPLRGNLYGAAPPPRYDVVPAAPAAIYGTLRLRQENIYDVPGSPL